MKNFANHEQYHKIAQRFVITDILTSYDKNQYCTVLLCFLRIFLTKKGKICSNLEYNLSDTPLGINIGRCQKAGVEIQLSETLPTNEIIYQQEL